jgi:hypothetical protein
MLGLAKWLTFLVAMALVRYVAHIIVPMAPIAVTIVGVTGCFGVALLVDPRSRSRAGLHAIGKYSAILIAILLLAVLADRYRGLRQGPQNQAQIARSGELR